METLRPRTIAEEQREKKGSRMLTLKVHLNKIFQQVPARSHDDRKSLTVKNVAV
jgi:hypothetical protein